LAWFRIDSKRNGSDLSACPPWSLHLNLETAYVAVCWPSCCACACNCICIWMPVWIHSQSESESESESGGYIAPDSQSAHATNRATVQRQLLLRLFLFLLLLRCLVSWLPFFSPCFDCFSMRNDDQGIIRGMQNTGKILLKFRK